MRAKHLLTQTCTGFRFSLIVLGGVLFTASAATANHQWSNYHWERQSSTEPITLSIEDNHTPATPNWSALLDSTRSGTASDGTSYSSVGAALEWNDPDGTVVNYGDYFSVHVVNNNGVIESFNDDYGDTGWLGVATIRITRGRNKHIVDGESKVNDYYVAEPVINGEPYDGFNEEIEWLHVLCQEIGHTFGVDHNREGADGGTPDDTCMNDETRPLRYPNTNDHDDELMVSNEMYGHDHDDSGGGGGGGGGGGPGGCHPVFGCQGISHVVWAEHYETLEQMFDAADLVVRASVLSSAFDGYVGRGQAAVPITQVILRIEETFKGTSRPVIVLEQTRGPGLELREDPGYVSGDEYLLYLRQVDNREFRTVNPDGRIRM